MVGTVVPHPTQRQVSPHQPLGHRRSPDTTDVLVAGVRALDRRDGKAAKSMASEKVVSLDELLTELLKVILDDDAGLSTFPDTIVDT